MMNRQRNQQFICWEDAMTSKVKSVLSIFTLVALCSGVVASYTLAQYQIAELRNEATLLKSNVASLQDRSTLNRESIVSIQSDVGWIRSNMERLLR